MVNSLVILIASHHGSVQTLNFFSKHNLRSNYFATLQLELSEVGKQNLNTEQKEKEASEVEDFSCQFCRQVDQSFQDPQALSVHYYRDCPMLSSCPYCQQVVELEHLELHI